MRIALTAILLCLALVLPADRAYADWQTLGTYRITGYSACARCCGKSDGITADGTYAPAAKGRIVAAPRGIPFGTRMWIDGVGEVVVHDPRRRDSGQAPGAVPSYLQGSGAVGRTEARGLHLG